MDNKELEYLKAKITKLESDLVNNFEELKIHKFYVLSINKNFEKKFQDTSESHKDLNEKHKDLNEEHKNLNEKCDHIYSIKEHILAILAFNSSFFKKSIKHNKGEKNLKLTKKCKVIFRTLGLALIIVFLTLVFRHLTNLDNKYPDLDSKYSNLQNQLDTIKKENNKLKSEISTLKKHL